jgi:hypothetical protein
MSPEEQARLAAAADRANQDIAAVALIRAMLARDFWTAGGIMERWDPHSSSTAGGQSFATALAVAAVTVVVNACGGDRDRALAHADYTLDAITAVKAPQTRVA